MQNRRRWLTRSIATLGVLSLSPSRLAFAAENAVELKANQSRSLYRVRIEMDLEGNANLPTNPLVSRKTETKLPIKSKALFDYEERLLRPAGAKTAGDTTTSERYYHEAQSTSEIDRNNQNQSLRETVRHAVVRRDVTPETIYAVNDYMTQQEMELLRIPASSITVDQVLPGIPVTTGQKYEVDQSALVALLNLASIEESDVLGEISEITPEAAKIQLRGKVSGSADGVPTVVRIVGKVTFDRRLATCTWLALAIHETREIGKAEPGFDIAATIKMVRQPLERTVMLPAKPIAIAMTEPVPQDRLYTEITGKELGFTTLMDRRWRMMRDVPGSAMMRMIENDRSIAQCDIRPLATLKAGSQWTMEAFQADVQRTLNKQLKQLVQAEERLSDSGLRVLKVSATGAVEGVPIHWVMLHFSDDSGRRMLATFTMDGDSASEFVGSDVQLADSLRFIEPERVSEQETAQSTSEEANAPSIARSAKSDEIQSASDLRRSSERR